MAIDKFDANCFLALVDILGFKQAMKTDPSGNKAWGMLDEFYQIGYDVLAEHRRHSGLVKIDGFFITDKAVLFTRGRRDGDALKKVRSLLSVIQTIFQETKQKEISVAAAIAYGGFKYAKRIEFPGIVKAPIYGFAYVNAWRALKETQNKPKILERECRIVQRCLPPLVKDYLLRPKGQRDEILARVTQRPNDVDHFHFE